MPWLSEKTNRRRRQKKEEKKARLTWTYSRGFFLVKPFDSNLAVFKTEFRSKLIISNSSDNKTQYKPSHNLRFNRKQKGARRHLFKTAVVN